MSPTTSALLQKKRCSAPSTAQSEVKMLLRLVPSFVVCSNLCVGITRANSGDCTEMSSGLGWLHCGSRRRGPAGPPLTTVRHASEILVIRPELLQFHRNSAFCRSSRDENVSPLLPNSKRQLVARLTPALLCRCSSGRVSTTPDSVILRR